MTTVDFRLDHFRLDVPRGKRLDVDIADSITDATVELTIEGASTLTVTVEDPAYRLLYSDTLSSWVWGDEAGVGDEGAWVRKGRVVDATLDGIPFRLVKVSKAGPTLTLTFEDREVASMRRYKGARKGNRARVTRAEFVAMLVREVRAYGGIRLHAPELRRWQPIARASERVGREARTEDGHKGINPRVGLTVKGSPATRTQLSIAERLLDVAEAQRAPPRAALALIEAAIIESVLGNPSTPSGDGYGRYGVLQARVGVSRGLRGTINTVEEAREIEYMAASFLADKAGYGFSSKGGAIYLARTNPTWSAGQIAQRVEMSAYPDRYDRYRAEAQAIINAYTGGAVWATDTVKKRYQFVRGRTESTWDASGRLVEEVGWRRFMRGRAGNRRLWVVSEQFLFAQRPELVMREGEHGVDWLDFDIDEGARRPVAEVRASVRAYRWTAWPGMVVMVKDAGPATGRWIVSSVSRSLVDPSGSASVVLRKPIPQKPEPANETRERRRRIGDLDKPSLLGGSGDAGEGVDAVYAAAETITRRNPPYGPGGHGQGWSDAQGASTLDCSSSTSLALYAGGMMSGASGPQVSDWFLSWGSAGKGRTMTVWVKPGSGANGHVWIEFYGRRAQRFDTAPYGSGGDGAELRYTGRSYDGFQPRHWPGT